MEVVGTYEGDTVAHIMLPFNQKTVCGIYVTGRAIVNGDEGFVLPTPSVYSTPCHVCADAVDRLEDLMLGIIE